MQPTSRFIIIVLLILTIVVKTSVEAWGSTSSIQSYDAGIPTSWNLDSGGGDLTNAEEAKLEREAKKEACLQQAAKEDKDKVCTVLSPGAIAGIVIGVIVACGLCLGALAGG
eukprot:gene22281-33600_t